jgi:hypothetical protein
VLVNEDAGYIFVLAMIIGVVKIIYSLKLNWKALFTVVLSTVIVGFFYYYNHDTRLIGVFISCICILKEDKRQVVKVLFWAKFITFVFVLMMGGYHHINGVALHGGMVMLLYMCIEEKYMYEYYLKLFLMCFWACLLYLYTDSGSAGVGLLVCVLLYMLKKTQVGRRFLQSKIVMFIFPIMLFLNYFFAVGVGEKMLPFVGQFFPDKINQIYISCVEFLDSATSSRLTLVKYSFVQFGSSWLGGNVDYRQLNLQQGQYFNLDSGFIWLVQGWGYILCILVMVLCVLLMRYFIQLKEYNYIIAGIVIALWAVNEDMLVSVGTNFMLIFIGQALMNRIEKAGKKYEYT